MRSIGLLSISMALAIGACGEEPLAQARHVSVAIDDAQVVAEIDERFLSVAVDSAQATGGTFWGAEAGVEGSSRVAPYDFSRSRLKNLVRPLAPAYLRIGGTAADRVFYDLAAQPTAAPAGFAQVLTAAQWDDINQFAFETGLEIFFTLNAGPGPRGPDRAWRSDNARALVAYSAARKYPVKVWELGNEVHGFPLFHRLHLSPTEFARDAQAARTLLSELAPGSRLAGPASAYWPDVGEAVRFLPEFLAAGGGDSVDIVSWHYYPQQSQRCPVAVRRAQPGAMLEPRNLDAIDPWIQEIKALTEKYHLKNVWLGETGNAQCGGQAGVSDRFEGGFWWLDQLGKLARAGSPVVVRQTLSGSDYGLIDDVSLEPNPDYWSSLLWRTLMGQKVLSATSNDPKLRVYAHCTRNRSGFVTLLFLNLDRARSADIMLPAATVELYELTAPGLSSRDVFLNGSRLQTLPDGRPPILTSSLRKGPLSIPPASYGFAVFPHSGNACLSESTSKSPE